MAVNQSEEFVIIPNRVHVQEKLTKIATRFDEANQHCSLDILPILFEKASFPFRGSHDEDISGIPTLPEEGEANSECASQLALSFMEVFGPSESQMCWDTQLNCQKFIDIHVNGPDADSSCIVDIDIEKEKMKAPESCEVTFGSLKTISASPRHAQKVLLRQASLKMGEKLVQLLMDLMFLKFSLRDKPVTEKVHDTPNNRWRKYKRSASFDSRKIVILFSILSSLGTLILIYLTLRVRQQQGGDGSIPL